MEKLEFDELEKLLGEIPNVTSGNPTSEKSGISYCQKKLSRLALDGSLNLDKTEPVYGISNEPHSFLGANLHSPHSVANLEDPSNLSFINGTAAAVEPPNFRHQPSFVNGEQQQHMNCLEKIPLNRKPFVTVFQSPRLPRTFLGDFCCFNSNDADVRNQQDVPLLHRNADVEFPVTSNHHYYMDSQSLPYFHQTQVCQPWIYLEEQHYRMHMQYLHNMKQLENQNPVQGNWSTSQRVGQQFVKEPICEKLPYAVQFLDETSKNYYHEKISAHSQKFHSFKPDRVGVGLFRGNEGLAKANHYENLLPNGHPTRNVGFQYNCLSPRSDNNNNIIHQKLPLWDENSVEILSGKIYNMAKDQNGCRLLQRKFSEGTSEDIQRIFGEIIMHIVELMTDPFGNYLIQKLLDVCNEDQKMQILHEITRNKGDLVRISCNMHGTRAVQKVIENLRTPEQFSMVVSSLKLGIVNLIKNMNGNHVAQCCLQYLTPEYSEFLFEAVASNCVELATDRHGCCVLQKCLNHPDCEQRCHLIKEITSNALLLSQDQFGNYVVQFIFDIHLPWAMAEILDQLEGNYGDLSVQKYSSNVVEKCLKHAGEERRTCIIQELINNPRLDQIMQDPYGNYVIQAALNLSKVSTFLFLLEKYRKDMDDATQSKIPGSIHSRRSIFQKDDYIYTPSEIRKLQLAAP